MYNFAHKKSYSMTNAELRNLIILFQKNSMITLSWGMETVTMDVGGLKFKVSGKKYQGDVSVTKCDNSYRVVAKGEVIITKRAKLIDVIDSLIETDESQNL